jgi:hypothetical protein
VRFLGELGSHGLQELPRSERLGDELRAEPTTVNAGGFGPRGNGRDRWEVASGAETRGAVQQHKTPVLLHDPVDNGESKTGAVPGRLASEEGFERLLLRTLVQPGPCIRRDKGDILTNADETVKSLLRARKAGLSSRSAIDGHAAPVPPPRYPERPVARPATATRIPLLLSIIEVC